MISMLISCGLVIVKLLLCLIMCIYDSYGILYKIVVMFDC